MHTHYISCIWQLWITHFIHFVCTSLMLPTPLILPTSMIYKVKMSMLIIVSSCRFRSPCQIKYCHLFKRRRAWSEMNPIPIIHKVNQKNLDIWLPTSAKWQNKKNRKRNMRREYIWEPKIMRHFLEQQLSKVVFFFESHVIECDTNRLNYKDIFLSECLISNFGVVIWYLKSDVNKKYLYKLW